MTAPVASLREQVEAALQKDLKGIGGLRAVRLYEGELGEGADRLEAVKRSLNGVAPAALIATGDARFTTVNLQRRRFTRDLDLQLVVVARSLRTRADQRNGPVGIYALLETLETRLAGWDPSIPGVGRLRIVKETPLEHAPDSSVWLLTLAVETDFVAPDREELVAADLTEIAGTVNLPEDVGVLAQGVGNSLTVSSGVVTLTNAAMASGASWVGLRVRIADAHNEANEGDFPVTAAPAPTQIQFTNPAASPESSSFTWKLLAPAPLSFTVEVEQP